MQGLGGLLLATSFFLPALDSCNNPIVPAELAVETISDTTARLDERGVLFLLVIAPYLFGLITVPVTLRRVFDGGRFERGMGWSEATLLGTTATAALILVSWEFARNGVGTVPAVFGTIALVAGAYLMSALYRGLGGLVCVRWYCSVCCLAFHTWLMGEGPRYGLFVSLGGAVLIGAGAYAEAKIRCGRGWRVTLGQLACCRLRLLPTGDPRCTKCGYLLIGLTMERCPECGQQFRWSDFGALSEAE